MRREASWLRKADYKTVLLYHTFAPRARIRLPSSIKLFVGWVERRNEPAQAIINPQPQPMGAAKPNILITVDLLGFGGGHGPESISS